MFCDIINVTPFRKQGAILQDRKELWEEVERLQEELHEISSKKGINSPEAIRASQVFRNKMKEYTDLK